MSSPLSSDARQPLSGNKVQGVITHCLYMIATGKWLPGKKLPSIREGERMWSVHRLTIVKGYRALAEMGLVEARTQSGFYVAGAIQLEQRFKHRHGLERLYEVFAEQIRSEAGLSPLGTFRYLAQLAEIEHREKPAGAFLECTQIQALGHANEVQTRLRVPVLPLNICELDGNPARIPRHVKTLLVSMFHWEEASFLGKESFHLVPVPIEVAPEVLTQFKTQPAQLLFLGSEEIHASHIAEDVRKYVDGVAFELEVPDDLTARLEQCLSSKEAEGTAVVVSPRVWGNLPVKLRDDARVGVIRFQISEMAWPSIAEGLGLPLGDLGSS